MITILHYFYLNIFEALKEKYCRSDANEEMKGLSTFIADVYIPGNDKITWRQKAVIFVNETFCLAEY